jgi:hypothetical protein
VASCCEHGDEPSGSGAKALVSCIRMPEHVFSRNQQIDVRIHRSGRSSLQNEMSLLLRQTLLVLSLLL